MNDSKHPRRRRSALADHNHQNAVEENTQPESFDGKTVEAKKEPHKTKNLYRESWGIAQRYGAFIGRDAFYCAAKAFQPTPESFSEAGAITHEGVEELLRLMAEAIVMYKDYSCHVWRE